MAMKLYPESAIQDIADAIREKAESSDTFKVSEMAEAIEGISGGGLSLDGWASGKEPSGEIDISDMTVVEYGLRTMPHVTRITGTNVTLSGGYQFTNCDALESVNLHFITTPSGNMFLNDQKLKVAVLVFNNSAGGSAKFNGCTKLEIVDATYTRIRTNDFYKNSSLHTIILRPTTLVTIESMTGTIPAKFASGGAGGTIYIPKVLYDHLGDGSSMDYQSATNWSTVHGYGTITWAQIEGSEYETHYADGTVIV